MDHFENDRWDVLIVLDACRFDFFSHFHERFFTGTLTKVSSPGSCTREWFTNCFKQYFDDVIYVSANPYINSILTLSSLDVRKRFFKLDAKNHFYKVVDVWRFGWNDELGTVHPETLTKAALSLRDRYPTKRLVIHYLQPHAPYISDQFFFGGFPRPNIDKGQILTGLKHDINPRLTALLRDVTFLLEGVNFNLGLGNLYTVTVKKFLRLPPADPMDATIRMHGISGLRKAYAENLKNVLGHIAFLTSQFSGMVIVTSDHGEFLGERRRFGHPCGCHDPIARIVPWFRVSGVKSHLKHKEALRYRIFTLKQRNIAGTPTYLDGQKEKSRL